MSSRLLAFAQNRFLGALALSVILTIAMPPAVNAQSNALPSAATLSTQNSAAAQDPILQAMLAELNRSRDQLKMDNVAKPYYIEYRITDRDIYEADSAFGAMRYSQRVRQRVVRAVVRIGDYKQDSYYGTGQGAAEQITLEDDIFAMRHSLWLLTDTAYKRAGEALAAKQAMLKEVTPDLTTEDFAHAPVVVAVDPTVKLTVDQAATDHMLKAATAIYVDDPDLQMLDSAVTYIAKNDYFINSEGTITRHGQTTYQIGITGVTQAKDGMQLMRTPSDFYARADEIPSESKLVTEAHQVVATLKALREAPIVEEEYRGPVLLSSDAASDVLATLIGDNLSARKPGPGRGGRTVGQFASAYKSRVLPNFVTVIDDPTQTEYHGESLVGSYHYDDEGVRVAPLTVIDKGQLVSFLTTRQPIQDFPTSNGHAMAANGAPPQPHFGVLTLVSSEAMSPDDLKKKLIQMCKDQGKPYGYRVETFGGLTSPRLLYRVWANDGHEELVRGALLNELDVHGLRNDLIAVGNDMFVSNRSGTVPNTVISSSMLFDELEIRRDDRAKAKLPEYPAPPIISSGTGAGSGQH
jgi:TldD protein